MTSEGHFFFSICFSVFAKNAELTSVLAKGDWWHIISAAIITCLIPDIDHPKSFLGKRFRWISKPISKTLGHRGFTHSLLAIFSYIAFFYVKKSDVFIFSEDIIQGMILGYLSHIIADMLTPAGVPLFWPCKWRFCLPILLSKNGKSLERVICIILFILSIWIPQTKLKSDIKHWSLQKINLIKNLL